MEYPIKTVCVVGLGYIGLPTAATLASRGVEVIGVDINPRVVEAVNAGQPLFSEPDLDMLLRAATTLRKLRATSQPEPADAFVIARGRHLLEGEGVALGGGHAVAVPGCRQRHA